MSSAWGLRLIPTLVRVHKGFFSAWVDNGYDQRLLKRVGKLLEQMGGASAARVMVTGHSLGGAMATLAAHAIKTRFPNAMITVYTYGQPRVGNRAFMTE